MKDDRAARQVLMTKLIEMTRERQRAARENAYATPLSKFHPGNPELFRTDTLCVALHQPTQVRAAHDPRCGLRMAWRKRHKRGSLGHGLCEVPFARWRSVPRNAASTRGGSVSNVSID